MYVFHRTYHFTPFPISHECQLFPRPGAMTCEQAPFLMSPTDTRLSTANTPPRMGVILLYLLRMLQYRGRTYGSHTDTSTLQDSPTTTKNWTKGRCERMFQQHIVGNKRHSIFTLSSIKRSSAPFFLYDTVPFMASVSFVLVSLPWSSCPANNSHALG